MEEIKISKKGMLGIAFLFFLIGIIIGGMLIATKKNSNWLMTSFFIVIVSSILYPKIRKEIREEK